MSKSIHTTQKNIDVAKGYLDSALEKKESFIVITESENMLVGNLGMLLSMTLAGAEVPLEQLPIDLAVKMIDKLKEKVLEDSEFAEKKSGEKKDE